MNLSEALAFFSNNIWVYEWDHMNEIKIRHGKIKLENPELKRILVYLFFIERINIFWFNIYFISNLTINK